MTSATPATQEPKFPPTVWVVVFVTWDGVHVKRPRQKLTCCSVKSEKQNSWVSPDTHHEKEPTTHQHTNKQTNKRVRTTSLAEIINPSLHWQTCNTSVWGDTSTLGASDRIHLLVITSHWACPDVARCAAPPAALTPPRHSPWKSSLPRWIITFESDSVKLLYNVFHGSGGRSFVQCEKRTRG